MGTGRWILTFWCGLVLAGASDFSLPLFLTVYLLFQPTKRGKKCKVIKSQRCNGQVSKYIDQNPILNAEHPSSALSQELKKRFHMHHTYREPTARKVPQKNNNNNNHPSLSMHAAADRKNERTHMRCTHPQHDKVGTRTRIVPKRQNLRWKCKVALPYLTLHKSWTGRHAASFITVVYFPPRLFSLKRFCGYFFFLPGEFQGGGGGGVFNALGWLAWLVGS